MEGRYQIIFVGRNRGMLPLWFGYGDFDGECESAVEDDRHSLPSLESQSSSDRFCLDYQLSALHSDPP